MTESLPSPFWTPCSTVTSLPQELKCMCVHAKSLQSCPTFCDPMDCNPPGSSAHGILQARILEWIAMPFPSPGDLPDPGVEPTSLMSPALAGRFFTTNTTWKALRHTLYLININNSSMALSYFLSISNSEHNLFSLTHLVPEFQQFFDPWTYLLIMLMLSHFSRVRLCATP